MRTKWCSHDVQITTARSSRAASWINTEPHKVVSWRINEQCPLCAQARNVALCAQQVVARTTSKLRWPSSTDLYAVITGVQFVCIPGRAASRARQTPPDEAPKIVWKSVVSTFGSPLKRGDADNDELICVSKSFKSERVLSSPRKKAGCKSNSP